MAEGCFRNTHNKFHENDQRKPNETFSMEMVKIKYLFFTELNEKKKNYELFVLYYNAIV